MYLPLSLTIPGLAGNHDVPQVRRSTQGFSHHLSECKISTLVFFFSFFFSFLFRKQAANAGAALYPHGALHHGDEMCLL